MCLYIYSATQSKKVLVSVSLLGILLYFGVHIVTQDKYTLLYNKSNVFQSIHKNLRYSEIEVVDNINLYDKVRVLCWIMTRPSNRETKAIHVKATWGKRCNKLLFMSTENNSTVPSIDLGVQEGRAYLWNKTKEAFKYVYKHHQEEYDWVLKADDDTYVIVENLRYLLSLYDPALPIWLGANFKHGATDFMSGGGGYVLSKEAVQQLAQDLINQRGQCLTDPTGPEDLYMTYCLKKLGVLTGDSIDESGKCRFFPIRPYDYLNKGCMKKNNWVWKLKKYPLQTGKNCCSDTSISFHYVSPEHMHELDYLLYDVVVVGHNQSVKLPPGFLRTKTKFHLTYNK